MLATHPQFYGWKAIQSVIVYPADEMGPAICWVLKGTRPEQRKDTAPSRKDKRLLAKAKAKAEGSKSV